MPAYELAKVRLGSQKVMNGIYLLMGSNLGNRLEYLKEATRLLLASGVQVLDESSIYETEPWGQNRQDWFLNVVLEVNTSKSPIDLLDTILGIEKQLGRVRKEKWGERTIDIDILYFHNQIVNEDRLSLPHKGIKERRFTLIPLVEMMPLEIHPTLKKTQLELLAECTDPLDCNLTDYKL